MTDIHELELRGCSPDPLMSYLKALGVFRLVSEQVDSDARAWWANDTFHLSSALDRDRLTDFFLNEYRPTPIVSPWNGGSGFYARGSKAAREAIQAVDTAEYPHLDEYRKAINASRRILNGMGIVEKPSKSEKQAILAGCRNLLSDISVSWLDAAYVLTTSDPRYTPLLGTGGNDGNMDFGVNFIKNLIPALTGVDIGKSPSKRFDPDEKREGWLNISLYDYGDTPLVRSAVGQFNPGRSGGANASVGPDGALLNPWDYVLMFEGALIFAGAAARRLSAHGGSKAVFPFTVDNSAAGYGTATDSEYGDSSRAEFWAPLWKRPASLRELEHLMSEGRAQLGHKQVSSGSDFARAVAGLGTERGVSEFERYGFLVRNGLSYLATPLGRFHANPDDQDTTERANVLFDLDPWLDSLRRAASGRNAPAELGAVRRRIDNAIIEFCQRGQPRDLQDVLIAVGQAERWVSRSGIRESVRPLANLSTEWLRHANDGLVEFRLARAMASILHEPERGQREVGPMRENLEPVATQPRVEWKDGSVSYVWTAGDPLFNMLSVLQRRCLEGRMQGLGEHPPLDSTYSARLSDVVAFLNGEVDIQRVADLALPLSFVRYWHRAESGDGQSFRTPLELSTAYAAMKLTLLPGTFKCPEFGEDRDIRMEPRMLAMLRAGRVKDAYEVASRRLVASGLRPVSDGPGIPDRSEAARHLAAVLLFPIDERAYGALAERALRKPEDQNSEAA